MWNTQLQPRQNYRLTQKFHTFTPPDEKVHLLIEEFCILTLFAFIFHRPLSFIIRREKRFSFWKIQENTKDRDGERSILKVSSSVWIKTIMLLKFDIEDWLRGNIIKFWDLHKFKVKLMVMWWSSYFPKLSIVFCSKFNIISNSLKRIEKLCWHRS